MRQVSRSGLSFQRLREDDAYFVDKTLLIRDILDRSQSGVYLFTRPRRFGKTTNLSMLDAFFNIKYNGNTWFNGLEISKHHEYDEYRNAFPVIHLDMKPSKGDDYGQFITGVRLALSKTFNMHRYLLDSDIMKPLRDLFSMLDDRSATDERMVEALLLLSEALEAYHGKKVIILIDEYDAPVSDAFGKDFHRQILSFLRQFLGSALKSNSSLQMAYMTGVMQIAKESIFSDLNNVVVNNVFSKRSDERFGFTESEVKELFAYYGHPEKFEEAREWYDGYRFGDAEVYNPFSIMSYVDEDFTPKRYWVNSGGDWIIRSLLEHIDDVNFMAMTDLVTGKSIMTHITETLAYGDLYTSDESLFSLMVISGYLNAVPADDGMFDVSIPNSEIMGIVNDMIRRMNPVNSRDFAEFNRLLVNGDAEGMAEKLGEILQDESYLTLRKEFVYQAIVVTILHLMNSRYEIRAEYEAGNGRADVFMRPRSPMTPWIIMELKAVKTESKLDSGLDEALNQIREKRYSMGIPGEVVLIGMSFWKKVPKVRVEISKNKSR